MIKYKEMHPGMKVYFVHHKPGEDPYVDSATITATSYICKHPETGEPLYPAVSSYRKAKMLLTLNEMHLTEEDAGHTIEAKEK